MSREVRPVLPEPMVETSSVSGGDGAGDRRVDRGRGSLTFFHNGERVSVKMVNAFLGREMWAAGFPEGERELIVEVARMLKIRPPDWIASPAEEWLSMAVLWGPLGRGVGLVRAWREDPTECLRVCWRHCVDKARRELAAEQRRGMEDRPRPLNEAAVVVPRVAGKRRHLHERGGAVYMMLEPATVRTLEMAAAHIHRLSSGGLFSNRGHNAHANMVMRAALEALVIRDDVTWPPRFLAGSQDPDVQAAEDLIRGLEQGGGL
jgi:hypothetical protein